MRFDSQPDLPPPLVTVVLHELITLALQRQMKGMQLSIGGNARLMAQSPHDLHQYI